MFTFLLIVQALIAAALVAVILMQRSEGGGLGVGGSSSGLMTARGAADFLTRATAVLATLFVVLSIALAGIATVQTAPTDIDPSLARTPGSPAPTTPLPNLAAPTDDPLAGAAAAAGDDAVTFTPSAVPAAPPAGTPASRATAPAGKATAPVRPTSPPPPAAKRAIPPAASATPPATTTPPAVGNNQ